MGDSLYGIPKEANLVMSGRKQSPSYLVASRSKASLQSLGAFRIGNGVVSQAALFVVKVAALEAVRRLSRAKCPWVWRGFQALQFLCYPPFKWFRRFAPFKALVDNLQTVSKPLLALSIGTAFTDELEFGPGTKDDVNNSDARPEVPSAESSLDTSVAEVVPQNVASERWLIQLHNELERQGLSLPERIDEEELRRFYTAANRDFSSFMSAIKKTIRWRETYGILSVQELEKWSNMVFWHGFDVKHRPCLIVRLGIACISLPAHDKPRFAQAIISQVDHGVFHLLDANNTQITVVVDCEGLTPLKIPMQVLRTCSSLLQDHFPNRLGCLFVVRLPPMLRVIAQTFIQVLKPYTREKLRIEGKMYQRILSECLETLPSFLGGKCLCKICSDINTRDMQQPCINDIMKRELRTSVCEDGNFRSPSSICESEVEPDYNCDRLLRTAIVSILMFWILVAFIAGFFDPGSGPFSSSRGKT
uniref:SEC14-like protein 5 n=1 Tax=Fragaria vesca subsp. vesca TaxID=101020 RepID=UPI0005C992A8|nr:PREDICTED: SEC14-like protein 5 [Fragaria vesca subsp. vesca]